VLYPDTGSEIEITQEELGLLAGVSRQVANRSLQELEEEGVLRTEHGRIMVIDLKALSNYEG
jgi:DNA-binding transcriptional regulator YhcF (GntR family)